MEENTKSYRVYLTNEEYQVITVCLKTDKMAIRTKTNTKNAPNLLIGTAWLEGKQLHWNHKEYHGCSDEEFLKHSEIIKELPPIEELIEKRI